MQVYYAPIEGKPNLGSFVASHAESENVSTLAYGETIRTFFIDDIVNLERDGDAPEPGRFDLRPIIIPSVQNSTLLQDSTSKQILKLISDFGDAITSKYSQAEMLSWSAKEAAAHAAKDGEKLTSTQEALLDNEQKSGGYASREELVDAVIAKALAFSTLVGQLAGLRTTAEADIANAKSQHDLDQALANVQKTLEQLKAASA